MEGLIMTPNEGIHIRHDGDRWLVERGNYLLGEFRAQDQALELGRTRAKSSQSELIIHSDDGSVVTRESYKEVSRRRAG
jgi:hypothetical protein